MNNYLYTYLGGVVITAVYCALNTGFIKGQLRKEIVIDYWKIFGLIVLWPYFFVEFTGEVIGRFFRK